MTKVNYPNRRSATAASSRQGRWVMGTFARLVCCTLLAVTHGADQTDSGWAIAVPSPLGTGSYTVDSHQQLILRKVAEQPEPLLQKPSPTAQTAAQHKPKAELVASRPAGVDGWRAAGKAATPAEGSACEQAAGPSLGSPVTDSGNDDEAECDCSGHNSASSVKKPQRQSTTPSSLADAYDNMSPDEGPVFNLKKQPAAAPKTVKAGPPVVTPNDEASADDSTAVATDVDSSNSSSKQSRTTAPAKAPSRPTA